MSFGGFGNNTGFGGSTTNTTGSLFGGGGGFGSNNNANNGGGFGAQNTNAFGSTNNNSGGGGGFGGFGSTNNNNTFAAAKPAFGASTSNTGGLFGSNTTNNNTTSGFGTGGFGSTANNATSAFGGGGTTGSSLFGAAKSTSTFGSGGSTMFGGSNFGANNNSTGFGASASSGNIGECQGTAQPAYSATTEKEVNSTVVNHFQSIVHMQPYSKWSFEELRLADYNAGRRYANANGQAGGFGVSTGFGGFSNNTNNNQAQGGLFGNNNNTAATGGGLFGNTNTTTNTGFGANNQTSSTGFGGFGANKPAATGGLFGNATNNNTTTQTSLFGATGGFGSNNNTSGFGANNAATGGFGTDNSAKPSLFGAAPTTTGGGIFGNNNNNNNTLSGGFGSAQPAATTNLFGSAQPAANTNLFGAATNTGGGLFGNNNNNQNKPSLFSTPAANTGSLFGANQQNNTQGGGLFGNNNQSNNTGGLFGAAKPAGTSIFGNAPAQQNTGSSLFGNTQNQPAQGGMNLFGNANKPAGLFGASTTQNNAGNSLFGASQPQAQQSQNSLFGNSLNANQGVNLQPPQGLTASIYDSRPYGSVSIFDGLPPPPSQNVGPIATPISSGQKTRKPAVLPQWKLNPTMSPRFVTPQKQGYGFSYSRYGTPSSISSVASTPGHFGNSLLGASMGRNIGKSVSVSNLRRNYDADGESILAPGAFTSSTRINGQHSLKKLNIDRSLRSDLFAPITQGSNRTERADPKASTSLKKRVSFEASSYDPKSTQEVVQITEDDSSPTPSAEEQGYLRSSTSRNIFNGQPTKDRRSRDASPVKGNELAIVPEDASPEVSKTSASSRTSSSSRPGDPQPANYITRPSVEELKKMSPEQLKGVSGFSISRENVGSCSFQRPVDLSWIKWDNFFDVFVKFNMRSICVYPDQSKKPPVGMGINVPSLITLENCWPRSRNVRSGPRLDKHIKHLQSVTDCKFISYNVDKGEWTFEVPHFTTYGLDYEDQDDMDTDGADFKSSMLSDTFSEATPDFIEAAHSYPYAEDAASVPTSAVPSLSENGISATEDTFDFRASKLIPGGFDAISISGESDVEMEQMQQHHDLSFLGQRSAVPESEDEYEPSEILQGEYNDERSLGVRDTNLDLDMAGAFPGEPANAPKSILKKSAYAENEQLGRSQVFLGNDWTEQLQQTISPRKYDRQELKASQAQWFQNVNGEVLVSPTKKSRVGNNRMETSIDLMNSLFGKEDIRKSSAMDQQVSKQGFKWPYNKDVNSDATELDAQERAFHDTFKPRWGPGSVLVHAVSENIIHSDSDGKHGPDLKIVGYLASEGHDIRLSKFNSSKELTKAVYERQFKRSQIVMHSGVPFAQLLKMPFAVQDTSAILPEEALIWNLASILFDDQEDDIPKSLPTEQRPAVIARVQKNRLSEFWKKICESDALQAVASSQSPEERSIHYLSMGATVEACNALVVGKNFRLSTLISQIGGDKIMHQDMAQQIKEWRRLNVLSEMTEPIRALYEMLAGNVCLCEGRQGAVEDRASTFVISQRFRLGWARAFGLRLWYALEDNEPLEAAIEQYRKDIDGHEKVKPKPWFLERDGYNPPWSDPSPEVREDVLWGLLKLHHDFKVSRFDIQLADVVAPENVRGNPMDNRLSWELYSALSPYLPQRENSEAADKLTISFAAELESASKWTWAVFVLLHLTDAEQRQMAIKDIIGRQAAIIDIEDEFVRDTLFNQLHIPQAWIYEAKALYARAVQRDRSLELHYLLLAGNWNEAHSVLCESVAPRAIIERDHELLIKVLQEFEHAEKPHDWRIGGAVYSDYLSLINAKDRSDHGKLLKRVTHSISDLASRGHANDSKNKRKRNGSMEKGSENEGFLQTVAVQEMGRVIADMALQNQSDTDREYTKLLNLPLGDEIKRDRSVEIGLQHYRRIMAAG